MPMIRLGQDDFHYRLDGPEGAPVLMLSDSLGCDLTMWDAQVPHWTRTHRVLRYDSRGHGQSAAPDRPYSMAELGRDALALMDALGIATVDWCGLSKGGMVGMWLLTHARHRIRRAVLANTAPNMGPPDLWNTRIRTARGQGMAALAEPTRTRWFSEPYRATNPPEADRIIAAFAAASVAGYIGSCAAIRDMDQREAIRSITTPVLVIIGAVDPATPPAAGRLIAASIPGAKSLVLQAAHISNLEQPEAFTRAVAEFLA